MFVIGNVVLALTVSFCEFFAIFLQKYCMKRSKENIKTFLRTSKTSLEEIRYVEGNSINSGPPVLCQT